MMKGELLKELFPETKSKTSNTCEGKLFHSPFLLLCLFPSVFLKYFSIFSLFFLLFPSSYSLNLGNRFQRNLRFLSISSDIWSLCLSVDCMTFPFVSLFNIPSIIIPYNLQQIPFIISPSIRSCSHPFICFSY